MCEVTHTRGRFFFVRNKAKADQIFSGRLLLALRAGIFGAIYSFLPIYLEVSISFRIFANKKGGTIPYFLIIEGEDSMEKDKPKTVIDLKESRFARNFDSSELIHKYEYERVAHSAIDEIKFTMRS